MCFGDGKDEETRKSREIDALIHRDEKVMQRQVKLLLLGAGESGKSTILKQMRLIYTKEGFTKTEKEEWRVIIFNNILDGLRMTIDAMQEFGIDFEYENTKVHLPTIMQQEKDLRPYEPIPIEYSRAFKDLWKDPGMQKAIERGNEFALFDNLAYFFNDIDRLFNKEFVPTDQDVLRARLRTIGITETYFDLGSLRYRMFDVGGQRSERKKWIHCFDQVTAVIFVAAISEYNQVLYEDNSMNRITEALLLFEEIANSKWFKQTSIILFLNKRDLFAEKICEVPFRAEGRFEEFRGPHVVFGTNSAILGTEENRVCYEAAVQYLKDAFLARNKQQATKEIYTHVTCATDTKNVEVVFNACKDIILKSNLHGSGFM